jgi:hypothetical protein
MTEAGLGLRALLGRALALSHNVCMFLPRNASASSVKKVWWKAFMVRDVLCVCALLTRFRLAGGSLACSSSSSWDWRA